MLLLSLKGLFMPSSNKLLFFVNEGGFEDYTPIFIELGFAVDFEDSQRKVVKLAKKNSYYC